jgi:hypothetical protein
MASWYDDYDAGIKAIRNGDWGTAIAKMTAAINASPRENDKARTYGATFINYHPYYYRGVAELNAGRYQAALDDFEKTSGPGEIDLGSIETLVQRIKNKMESASPAPPTPQPNIQPPGVAVPVPMPSAAVITTSTATTSRKPSSTTALPADRELTKSAPALPADRELAQSAVVLPADRELTEVGSIAFNTPQHAVVGEPKVIELLLDLRMMPFEIAKKIREDGNRPHQDLENCRGAAHRQHVRYSRDHSRAPAHQRQRNDRMALGDHREGRREASSLSYDQRHHWYRPRPAAAIDPNLRSGHRSARFTADDRRPVRACSRRVDRPGRRTVRDASSQAVNRR